MTQEIENALFITRAIDALREYGKHKSGCALLSAIDRQPCDCGWRKIQQDMLGVEFREPV